MSSEDVKPYQIVVPDEALERLRAKLEVATLPGPTEFSDDPEYGSKLSDITRLVAHWRDKYDWRRAEAALTQPSAAAVRALLATA